MDDPGGDSFDRKFTQFRANFGEDIAVYDYDQDELLGPTAVLEEDMNDLNDETFGVDTIDQDFDFSGSTAQYLNTSEGHQRKSHGSADWITSSSLPTNPDPKHYGPSGSSSHSLSGVPHSKERPISLLDDPLLGPNSALSHRNQPGSSGARPPASAPPPSIAKSHKIRTLEEIEAELRANAAAAAKKNPPPSSLPPQVLTLEQVEAALLASNQEKKNVNGVPSRSSTPHGYPFAQVALPTRAQPVQQIQISNNLHPLVSPSILSSNPRTTQTPSNFSAFSHPAHPTHPQHSEWLRLQQQQHQMYHIASQQLPTQPPLSRHPAMPSSQALANRHSSNHSALGFSTNIRSGHVSRSGAQTPFLRTAASPIPVEDLRSAAEARIQEQERREALRRRKAAKIAEMSKYNNLMSQGDKDFITRIQVSQLVNPTHGQAGFDPYADDFYFHVYSAIRASRMAAQQQVPTSAADGRLHPISADERITQDYDGLSGPDSQMRPNRSVERRLTRRDYAMMRMAQNVQRIIDHAKERPKMSQVSLEGALGKIALRTRSAPRQMLQVQPAYSDDLTLAPGGENHPGALAGSMPRTALISAGQPAMSRRQILMSLERLYSAVLEVEQLRRTQPQLQSLDLEEADSQHEEWNTQYTAQREKIWKQLRILDPLGISHPHPFVSFISVAKGKRVLPRVIRLFTREQSLQVLTLLVATFETLDVVSDARLLDLSSDSLILKGKRSRTEVELETEIFMNCVVAPMMAVINEVSLELVTGLVALLMERNDLMFIARSKAGIAFLTLFLSRAELLRSAPSNDAMALNGSTTPTPEAISRWQEVFDQLFHRLSVDFPSLFPSTRATIASSQKMDETEMNCKPVRPSIDLEDEPVWQLVAALAVSTDSDGQQTLVAGLRGKVLENVLAANQKTVPDDIGALKIKNINLMLHALGLDASMIKL